MNTPVLKSNREPFQKFEASVNGTSVLYDFRGVVILPDSQTLIVSDLHLEKGAAFARRGLMHPPYDTKATLARLTDCLNSYKPKTIISLGDSFHDRHGATQLPETFRQQLVTLQKNSHWTWISGNHDPEPPGGLGGAFVKEVTIENLTFRHEPLQNTLDGEVAGHLHPAAIITRRGKSVRKPCFASDGKRLILPAFGTTTGCLSLQHRAFKGLFNKPNLKAYVLGKDQLYPVSFSRLGPSLKS